ncbi:unnamed protein product [Ceutorhynchus assimilis]|uniref:Uncharacterized protein n=1 Tax=Ceutorhynchus assimilis TaxID=467358 RepID=A0A9N9MW55_9CUCU|nr:unnamed protein product [Ceutorhynchus assimilis]
MFTLPNFCRVCLKYDKNLIDLAHIENEPNETLMSKLQLCVSEVEWTTFKPLLCHPCIKRLNIAYSFKKQCIQSAGVLKNYVELVKESQKKTESQETKSDPVNQPGTYMLLPNHKYVKILVGSQNQGTTGNANTFQNVFLNIIPTTTITPTPAATTNGEAASGQKNKDTNQNVFLNLNNTFQKFIPITSVDPPPLAKPEKNSLPKSDPNTNLNESEAEEMSVEIDPTSFLSLEHDDQESSNEESKDWDEVITKQGVNKINGTTIATNGKSNAAPTFVPILPKDDLYAGGHFLSTSSQSEISCESCQKSFPSIRLLKQHIKQFHSGKLPFKCDFCGMEYLTRGEFMCCLNRHKQDANDTSLTLKDFTGNPSMDNDTLSISLITGTPADLNLEPNENGVYVCKVCQRIFNSSSSLLRHRVRKHNQTNRKKYFIKGMKNAKCDICKRAFSTQSYMQLHRKLHLREDGSFKYKVQGRSKYKDLVDEEDDKTQKVDKDVASESATASQQESDTESENEDQPAKKPKLVVEDGSASDSQNKSDGNSSETKKESDSSGAESSDSNSEQDKNN